jgi:3-oxoacyl-[acyl-carrier-protein] synthase II
MTKRVGITGIGLVTPVGNDTASSWQAIRDGQSGVAPITTFDTSKHGVRIAAAVKDFNPLNYLDRKEVRRTERFIHFAVAAARQALEDSGLDVASMPDDVGIVIGSGSGGLQVMEDQFHILFEKGPDRISPFFITQMVTDMAAGYVSMMLGARGPNFATVSACATGANAIGVSFVLLRRGVA